jgi:putative copper export protein
MRRRRLAWLLVLALLFGVAVFGAFLEATERLHGCPRPCDPG